LTIGDKLSLSQICDHQKKPKLFFGSNSTIPKWKQAIKTEREQNPDQTQSGISFLCSLFVFSWTKITGIVFFFQNVPQF